MRYDPNLPLYLLAALVFAGMGFLLWALFHLYRESHQKRHEPAQTIDQGPVNEPWFRPRR